MAVEMQMPATWPNRELLPLVRRAKGAGNSPESACLRMTDKGIMFARVNFWQYRNSTTVRESTVWQVADFPAIVADGWEVD